MTEKSLDTLASGTPGNEGAPGPCSIRGFFERSDVDLAVWGLDERLYLRALAALLDLEPDIAVDLVETEHARPELRRVLEKDGVIV